MTSEPRLRTLRPAERPAFLDLMQAAFEERELFARYFECDSRLCEDDSLVALIDGRIVSGLQIFTRRIRLRGEPILLGGIGSVATHPEFEGRGLASALLRRAIDEMARRGMALSLLFTSRIAFYRRLGWVQVPTPLGVVHRARGAVRAPALGRPFEASDLPGVIECYERYTRAHDASTLRDEAYWRDQLRFAGNPDEIFRVVEREGEIVAYARRIHFFGLERIMEYARAEQAAPELASLLLELTPAEKPLFVPEIADARLTEELTQRARALDRLEFPDQMWRVLDRPKLAALAGVGSAASDLDLLGALVGHERAIFWPSDRF